MRVAGALMLMEDPLGVEITEDMIVAAWLHDVYEDTHVSSPVLANPFGHEVDRMVMELTNVYTREFAPWMNREQRKAAETERLANVSPQSQIIKLRDRIDNLRTIRAMDRGFVLLYCDESDALAEALTVAPTLQEEIFKLTEELRKEF
jgi:(p)ppGpp synthase/HD superfamily hydrolase